MLATFASRPFRHRLMALIEVWQQLFQLASDPYRPERHYMRGPGPKWHARHEGSDVDAMPLREPATEPGEPAPLQLC